MIMQRSLMIMPILQRILNKFIEVNFSVGCMVWPWCCLFQPLTTSKTIKVHIFWEGHKILRNLHQLFDWHYIGQIIGGDFANFFGLLRIYELYLEKLLWKQISGKSCAWVWIYTLKFKSWKDSIDLYHQIFQPFYSIKPCPDLQKYACM